MKHLLEPCPFCGGINTAMCQGEIGKVYFVRCRDCKAEGPTAMYGVEAAVEAWNNRVENE
ncbi:MAG: Lar family restriction alleviation protein [Methanoregula sp.]|jgi:Lar family restriction alleviation protein